MTIPTPEAIGTRAAAIFAGLTFRLVLIGAVVVLGINTYADIRIPLPLLPDIHWEGWKPKAERLQRTINDFDKAQHDAAEAAKAQKLAYEAKYKELADNADEQVKDAQADAMAAADAYIARNRVRAPADRGAPSGAAAAPESGSAPSADGRGPEAELVAVSEDDIRICTINTTRLQAAHDWAVSLGE